MGNFTKKPLYTYHDSIRTSDLRLVISIILVFALWLYLFFYKEDVRANSNVCKSEKCEQRLMRLTSCETFTKNKEKVIECASWKTTFARKQVTRFERAEIEKEITELYEKTHEKVWVDLDKIAYAVAMAETGNCKLGYWKTHNNCFWIKHWNTVPCTWVPKWKMCKFESKEESYEAFKKIWGKWYKDYPNYKLAHRWTWWDRVDTWLKHVNLYLNK